MSEFARTRYHAFRDRFGAAGVIIAVIALVAALGGTALAAGGLTKSQERQVTKIAKKYAGKPGAPGTNGTNGTNGAPGEKGAQGEKGPKGDPGTAGAPGKSVLTGTASAGECTEGGITVEVEGAGTHKKVCNGEEGPAGPPGPRGPEGPEGSPWTVNGTLPSGKTETGAWAVTDYKTGANQGAEIYPVVKTGISFTIPLAAPLENQPECGEPSHPACPIQLRQIGYDGTDNTGAEHERCPGKAAEPKAGKGFLCVYLAEEKNIFETLVHAPTTPDETGLQAIGAPQGTATSGAKIALITLQEEVFGSGTWAVTAP